MTASDARALYSDYLDGSLDDVKKDELQAFLAANPDSAAELMQFERMLSIVHRLPAQEPSLDLWAEFSPKLTGYLAEQKQGPMQRVRNRWCEICALVSEGIILWTHAMAARSQARFGKYVVRDPLQNLENE